MRKLDTTCLALVVALIAAMAGATLLEKFCGSESAAVLVYGSAWFAALWTLLAVASVGVLAQRKMQRRPLTLLLHAAFVVVLAGAATTRLTGRQGTLHLRVGEAAVSSFADGDGGLSAFPFSVSLNHFEVLTYPGTDAPMDYVSSLTFGIGGDTLQRSVSINKVLTLRGYRFYAASYDSDMAGSTLSVSYDPWGTGITYAGYLLLLAGMALFFFDPHSRFRRLMRGGTALLLALALAQPATAQESAPRCLPRAQADSLGRLLVSYNGRICPLSTLAGDLTVKLCGSRSYRGLSAEQVLSGWLFFPTRWADEPMVTIKDRELRRMLSLPGRAASLSHFYSHRAALAGGDKSTLEAVEKFRIIQMLCSGEMMRLFPYRTGGQVRWATPNELLPDTLPAAQRLFIKKSMNLLCELAVSGDHGTFCEMLSKMRRYQQREGGESLPGESRIAAELLYEKMRLTLPLALCSLVVGLIGYAAACLALSRGKATPALARRGVAVATALLLALLTLAIALRGFVAGHVPLSNGFETMQCMAWCALVAALLLQRRFALSLPFGLLVAGLALMVAALGEKNPQITPLMPVLASPLMSVHVMLVMTAYALLAFVMLNGATGLLFSLRGLHREAERLARVGTLMLYPALFALAAGIFVGAVWANISWGRYWGWDPKEVWALITLLVYSLPLHAGSIPRFRRPLFFHLFAVGAFLCVLVTYFGVNFLLGGMHSYA